MVVPLLREGEQIDGRNLFYSRLITQQINSIYCKMMTTLAPLNFCKVLRESLRGVATCVVCQRTKFGFCLMLFLDACLKLPGFVTVAKQNLLALKLAGVAVGCS